ncbi:MAG: alcohol dehydrogenase catalytic domain-containing protein [Armatimonadetes bacterium]|nr:alcohol dehydrogenase catalytic domain-containing protein [Armatimonadota bacterium]MDE2205502.1 alcohol dehydrogenase catalytic domain-containing protein [Armatimonadota bacterium]
MKALVFRGERQLAVEEAPEPRPAAGEALIEVSCCGICGSDLSGYLGHSARRNRSVPLIMGHEVCGTVRDITPGAGDAVAIGDRVALQPVIACGTCPACRRGSPHLCPSMSLIGIERHGGFAPLLAAPVNRLFPIPDSLPDSAAALCETLAVEVHLFREFAPPLLRCTVVLGCGPQGLLAIQLARLAGANPIVAVDIAPYRLETARKMGAAFTVDARSDSVNGQVMALTDGWGSEFVVETSGASAMRAGAPGLVAPGGTLALIGLGAGETEMNFLPVVAKEIRIQGSYCYRDDDFVRALELLSTGSIDTAGMTTVSPLADGAQLFDTLVTDPGRLVKVLLSSAS